MHINNFFKHTVWIIFSIIVFLVCCSEQPAEEKEEAEAEESPEKTEDEVSTKAQLESPQRGTEYYSGDAVEIELQFEQDAPPLEMLTLYVDGTEKGVEKISENIFRWESGVTRVGERNLQVRAKYDDGSSEQYFTDIVFKSNIEPEMFNYRVINTYPHDKNAFTQGLVYDGEYLFESTGEYGSSTLRRVELESGDVLQSVSLDHDLFGEGLSLFNGKLYQLTWKSGKGFVYDKETFRETGGFTYSTEGWGLTNDGSYFLKTDGSNKVYVHEPQNFVNVGQFEVYDQGKPVANLNEMEYVDGIVYANVFKTEKIVMFERETGRVTGWIDLRGILDERHHHSDIDVMNGIAYNPENGSFFVTGKNWPRLFEIEIFPN